MSQLPDYYSILQVTQTATRAELKRAFRRLARQFHPDLNPNHPTAAARFQQISEAYKVLSDPLRRSQYDERLGHEPIVQDIPPSQSAQILYQQGMDKLTQRDYPGAITHFHQAIALKPDWAEAYLGRCQAHDGLKADRAVLDDCYQMLQINPKMAQAYYYQGRARARLGYAKGAVDAYTQAIALDNTLAPAYYRRAQARLDLQAVAEARQDLFKASELFRAQRDLSQAQQAERLLNTLPKSSPSSPKTQADCQPLNFWRLAFTSIPAVVLNPGHHLRPVFARLQPRQAGWAGLLYAGIAIIGAMLSGVVYQSTTLPITSWRLGLAVATAYICLVLAIAIARWLGRGQGTWAGDLFLAGVALLPIAGALLLGAVATSLGIVGLTDLWVLMGCYSTLILYLGCTQLHHIEEPYAMLAVPLILFASGKAATLVAWY